MQLTGYGLAWFITRVRSERGQDLIEYSLFGGFVALSLMAAMVFSVPVLSSAVESMFTGIANCVDWNASSCGPF